MADRLKDRRIHLEFTDKAKGRVMEEGYDPVYGARPLKRAIQRELSDRLALKVLEGQFREGDTVRVEVGPGGLAFSTEEVPIAE